MDTERQASNVKARRRPTGHTTEMLAAEAPTELSLLPAYFAGLPEDHFRQVWLRVLTEALGEAGLPPGTLGQIVRCLLMVKSESPEDRQRLIKPYTDPTYASSAGTAGRPRKRNLGLARRVLAALLEACPEVGSRARLADIVTQNRYRRALQIAEASGAFRVERVTCGRGRPWIELIRTRVDVLDPFATRDAIAGAAP